MRTSLSLGIPPEFTKPVRKAAFRAIWIALNLATLLCFQLPIWLLYYAFPAFRQNKTWSWSSAVLIRICQWSMRFVPTYRPRFTAAPALGGHRTGRKSLFELIPPAKPEQFQGITSPDQTEVKPEPRPGSWYPSRYDPAKDADKRILLCFPSGAFVSVGHLGSQYSGVLKIMCPELNAKFFGIGFRLPSTQGNQFPAQLQDAISAYQHLLNLGISPTKVIFLGDSSGGNLILSLLRYIQDHPATLPRPAAAVLPCPWVDLTKDLSYIPKHQNYFTDFIEPSTLQWGLDCLSPTSALDGPYLSPALHPFHTSIPIWTQADTCEVFYDSIVKFAEDYNAVPGNDIKLFETQDSTHGASLLGTELGFGAQAKQMVADIHRFLDEREL